MKFPLFFILSLVVLNGYAAGGQDKDDAFSEAFARDFASLGLTQEELHQALEAQIRLEEERARQRQYAQGLPPRVVPPSAACGDGASLLQEQDEALARRLQKEEEQARQARFDQEFADYLQQEETEQMRQDQELARQLQQAEAPQQAAGPAVLAAFDGHPVQDQAKRPEFDARINTLHTAYSHAIEKIPSSKGVYELDVHAYNRQFKDHLEQYLTLDADMLETKIDHPWQEIQAQLLGYINSDDHRKEQYKCAPVFMEKHAKGYLASGARDPEVGHTYPALLSRCWDLCLRIHTEGDTFKIMFADKAYDVNTHLLDLLAYVHHEPIAPGGGTCAPGYAGRLMNCYIQLMNRLVD